MAIKKIRMRPEGINDYGDIVYPETNVEQVVGLELIKPARFVIGTSTSGWTSIDCDYLCDGVDDQIEINNALLALPASGGEIKILDGTYNITGIINVWSNNVSIVGNGNATILKRMWNSTFDDEGVILFENSSFSRVENISIDGNKAIYTSTTNAGIYLKTSGECIITNNNIKKCENGIVFFGTPGSIISNNVLVDNNVGILLDFYGINNVVNSNICRNNNIGIYLKSVSRSNVVGNSCIRGTGIAGDYTGIQETIKLDAEGTNNLVTGNIVYGKTVTNLGTGNSVIDNKFDTSVSELATHKENYMTHIDGDISDDVHGLAGKTIFETGSNSNGRYIKYDDGTLICSNLYTFSVAVNLGSSPIWETNSIGNFPFAHTFTEVPVCTVSKGTGGTAWIVTTGATTTKCNPIYFFSKRSEAAVSCQLSVIAIGRWK